jgi:hypothetical protein
MRAGLQSRLQARALAIQPPVAASLSARAARPLQPAACSRCRRSLLTRARAAPRSEESLRAELDALAASAAVPPDASQRVGELAALVFITLATCPPATVPRWSHAAAVSEASLAAWHGFCRRALAQPQRRTRARAAASPPHALPHARRSLISDAYFTKGYAWFPIDRLQLEQAATLGRVEAAPVVAERASLVFQARPARGRAARGERRC